MCLGGSCCLFGSLTEVKSSSIVRMMLGSGGVAVRNKKIVFDLSQKKEAVNDLADWLAAMFSPAERRIVAVLNPQEVAFSEAFFEKVKGDSFLFWTRLDSIPKPKKEEIVIATLSVDDKEMEFLSAFFKKLKIKEDNVAIGSVINQCRKYDGPLKIISLASREDFLP